MTPVTPPKWKQAVVTLAFIGLLWGSVELNKKNVRSANGPTKADPQAVERYGFKLEDVAKASGIDFVHQPPKLDPKLAPIQERVADMGAAIAVCDFDKDGWQDLYATNGHVDDIVSTYQSNLTFKQAPLLFHNEKGKKFNDVSKAAGMNYQIVGRGAAYGDIDSDGDLDIGVVDNNGKFLLLRNDGGNNNSWIKLRLVGEKTNRNAIGARVIVKAGGIQQQQYVRSGGSFLSESERTLTFGLGGSTKVDSIEVIWPGGTSQVLPGTDARSTYLITEGKGLEKR